MKKKNIIFEWFLQNGIKDIFLLNPINHFKKKQPSISTENNQTNNKFTYNNIYKNIQNKYENDYKDNLYIEKLIKQAREIANNSNTIDELKKSVEQFEGLEIKKMAKNTVFSDGNINSKIMVIGEAPGNNEDIEGKPFCGDSGKLLDNMFQSIGIERKNLYITNTVFWRPPCNRKPTKEEISICCPLLEKHIYLINPNLIICIGETALKVLTQTDLTITRARKNIFKYTNEYLNNKTIITTPLFHPSYLLRQSIKKKEVLYDLIFLKNLIKQKLV